MTDIHDNLEKIEIEADLHSKFYNHINENLLSVSKIADKLMVDRPYLSQLLKKKKPFTRKMRIKLNELLKTEF